MPCCTIGPARFRRVLGHRALLCVVEFAMSEFPAPAAPEYQLSDAVKRQMRLILQAFEGIDPPVVEVREMQSPVVRFQGNKQAFTHVFLNLINRRAATAGSNVDCDPF